MHHDSIENTSRFLFQVFLIFFNKSRNLFIAIEISWNNLCAQQFFSKHTWRKNCTQIKLINAIELHRIVEFSV